VKSYISLGEKPAEGTLNFEKWTSGYSDDEPLVLVDEDDPLFIMYTAGTTGRPKGAVITHRNEMVLWMLGLLCADRTGHVQSLELRALGAPPIFHLASLVSAVHVLPGRDGSVANQGLRSGLYHGDDREREDQCPRLGAAMTFFVLLTPNLEKYDTSSLQVWDHQEPFCRLRRENRSRRPSPM